MLTIVDDLLRYINIDGLSLFWTEKQGNIQENMIELQKNSKLEAADGKSGGPSKKPLTVAVQLDRTINAEITTSC